MYIIQECVYVHNIHGHRPNCFNSPSEPKADWAEGLVLPTRFSNSTTKAIETGVLTKGARAEIVHYTSTVSMQNFKLNVYTVYLF